MYASIGLFISSILLWFSTTVTFCVGFLWVGRLGAFISGVILFILVLVNVILIVCFIVVIIDIQYNTVSDYINVDKLYMITIIILFLAFIASIILLPLLIYRPATKYNNKMYNVTGHSLNYKSIPSCSDSVTYPCIINCNYFTDFQNFTKLKKCDKWPYDQCNLNNISCCINNNYFYTNNTCSKIIYECNAYKGSYHATINQTSEDCTAYFSGPNVHWGIPDFKVGWGLIFFIIFSAIGLIIFTITLFIHYTKIHE